MRVLTAARGALIALLVAVLAPVASAAGQETLYLGSDGFPNGSLVSSPSGGEMPNFDLGRDIYPGLFLERSTLGVAEIDGTRYQHWQVGMGGEQVSGYPSVVIWSAPAGFDPGKRGVFSVYLLDCDVRGGSCRELGASEVIIEKGRGGAWVESRLDFDSIDHEFAEGRHLAVRVVVSESSESDMMIGFGYPKHRSRLTIHAAPPPPPEEAEAVSLASVPVDNEIVTEKVHRLGQLLSAQELESDTTAASGPWVVSLALSTLALTALGATLISKLTKLGRHERRFVTGRAGHAQRRRISLSAR